MGKVSERRLKKFLEDIEASPELERQIRKASEGAQASTSSRGDGPPREKSVNSDF